MMLQALSDYLIIKKLYEVKKSDSPIIIPEAAVKYKQYDCPEVCEVVSIGPAYPYKDEVSIGDKLICAKHEGKPMEYEGVQYFQMKERFVYGKVYD